MRLCQKVSSLYSRLAEANRLSKVSRNVKRIRVSDVFAFCARLPDDYSTWQQTHVVGVVAKTKALLKTQKRLKKL